MIYKVSYYLYLIRSDQRCERAEPVPLALTAVSKANASDCFLPAHYNLLLKNGQKVTIFSN